MKIPIGWRLAAALIPTLILAGCGQADDASSAGKPVDEVKIGYFANVTHAQAVLGVASGDFADAIAPAKLTTRVLNAGPSLIEAMFASEVDIAYIGPGPALSAYQQSRGKAIRVIAGAARNGVVIVARRDLGITSFEQLKGLKIATPQHGNTQDISARHFIAAKLGADATSNIIPIANSEQIGMMRRGDIDAAWVPEPWGQMLISQADAQIVTEEKDLWPGGDFTLTVVVTTPEFLENHPDIIEKFLRVHRRWTMKLQDDPEAQVAPLSDALFSLLNKRLPEGVLPAALKRVAFSTEVDRKSFDAFATWASELNFTRSNAPLDRLIDTTLLQTISDSPTTQP